ncbi:MAG: hypothetical protein NZ901_06080 [Geminocystis sp.]|nr:hypothetical protein [Geminocystis sp.]HIK38401.1 hypothetical protein [Geminocystis sp. M7585_C2015_104]MCS7147746.1 hypothetical protein [Geminocystis sp.]MCX8079234.1 hypothetical protein [Geminocystis sp.]MDW8116680.1 hypothetical protein [Geminocystis sp.]
MWKPILTAIGVISLLPFAPLAIAQSNSTTPSFNRQECLQRMAKEGLKNDQAAVWCNYEQQCLLRAQKEGLPPLSAKSLCLCSIKEFRKRYSTEKFGELTRRSEKDKRVANQLREVGEACFEKVLFEE